MLTALLLANSALAYCNRPAYRISDWQVPSDQAIFLVVRYNDNVSATHNGTPLPVKTYCDDQCLVIIDSVGLPSGDLVLVDSTNVDDSDIGDSHITTTPTGTYLHEFTIDGPSGIVAGATPPDWDYSNEFYKEEVCRGESKNILEVQTLVPADAVGLLVRTSLGEEVGGYVSFRQLPYDVSTAVQLEGDPGTCHRAQLVGWDGSLSDSTDSVCEGQEQRQIWSCSTVSHPWFGVLWLPFLFARRRS